MKACSPPLPAVIVLAAGFSMRMGRPKALLRIHGRSLLQRTAAALAPFPSHPVVIVIPPRSALRRVALSLGWHCIVNPDRRRGLSSSVSRAMLHCRHAPALLFLPVDLAELRSADLRRLLLRWYGNRRCVVARQDAGRAVIPLILPHRLFALGHQLQGDTGLQPLIAAQPQQSIRSLCLVSAARDIDSPADLRAARRRYALSTF